MKLQEAQEIYMRCRRILPCNGIFAPFEGVRWKQSPEDGIWSRAIQAEGMNVEIKVKGDRTHLYIDGKHNDSHQIDLWRAGIGEV